MANCSRFNSPNAMLKKWVLPESRRNCWSGSLKYQYGRSEAEDALPNFFCRWNFACSN